MNSKLEDKFWQVENAMSDWLRPQAFLAFKDLLQELQVDVEEALAQGRSCFVCKDALPPLCPRCDRDEEQKLADHLDEVQMAHAATNGTL